MRKIFLLLMLAGLTIGANAQPEARRQAQQKAKQQSNANNMTTRAQIMFPTSATMGDDVVWRRDIYRELDLNDDANAPLYYPVEPVGGQMNLFTYMFKLMLSGRVRAYQYRLDGHESFNYEDRVVPKAFMDNYHIYYERKNGALTLDDSDIPSREVKSYYVKEATYYDQHTATFHTKVIALCPIMTREDDFGDAGTKYPLFWMKYSDLAPYLSKQQIMTSNLNNAAMMSIDDYFVKNQYKGKIYKTTNMLGKTLAQYCPTDSALSKEQKKIESELAAFEKNIWGDQARKDSLDSIANAAKKNAKGVKGVKKNRRSRTSGSSSTVKTRRQRSSGSSGSSAARVSVRRERH